MSVLVLLRQWRSLWVLLSALLLSACSMNIISSYDKQSMAQMLDLAKQVDAFYLQLADQPGDARPYQDSSEAYNHILTELYGLRRSQTVRALNDLTVKQVDIAIELWQQDIAAHKQNDGISNFILQRHREQFDRVFLAMIQGESAKATNADN